MNEVINLFTQEHGVFKLYFKFTVLVFFICILLFYNRFIGNNYGVIILILFALYLSNVYVKVSNEYITDNNEEIFSKLESLQEKTNEYVKYKLLLISESELKLDKKDVQKLFDKNKLDSLYIDSNMIVFLHSILKLSDYNLSEFYLLLKGTNNILKLKNEIEKFHEANEGGYPENITQMLENMIQLKSNCVNNIHNFVYSIPKLLKMHKYLNDVVNHYITLINKNINTVYIYHQDYIRKKGVNVNTKFINISFPKEFDSNANQFYI